MSKREIAAGCGLRLRAWAAWGALMAFAIGNTSAEPEPWVVKQFGLGGLGASAINSMGTQVATSGGDGRVRLWDGATGEYLRTLEGDFGGIANMLYVGERILVLGNGSDGLKHLWDATAYQLISTLGPEANSARTAISPDGRRILSSGDNYWVVLWDAETGQKIRSFLGHTDLVWSLAFSGDGKRGASADQDGTTIVWDLEAQQRLRIITMDLGWSESVSLSPTGDQILLQYNQDAFIWDVESGQQILKITAPANIANACLAPDGKRVLTTHSVESVLRVWNAGTGALMTTLSNYNGGCAFATSSTLVLGASSANITGRVFDYATGAPQAVITGHTGFQTEKTWSGNGQRIMTAHIELVEPQPGDPAGNYSADVLRLYDIDSLFPISTIIHKRDKNYYEYYQFIFFYSLALSHDGSRALGVDLEHNEAHVWDTGTGEMLRTIKDAKVTVAALSKDGMRVVAGYSGGGLRMWDVDTGTQVLGFAGHSGKINSVVYSADEQKILTASNDKSARLWDAHTGEQMRAYTGHTGAVLNAVLAPDGYHLLTVDNDSTNTRDDLRLWGVDAITPSLRRTYTGAIDEIAYSPDGKMILVDTIYGDSAADGAIQIYDSSLNPLGYRIPDVWNNDFTDQASHGNFRPGHPRQLLAWGRGGTAQLWELPLITAVDEWEGYR